MTTTTTTRASERARQESLIDSWCEDHVGTYSDRGRVLTFAKPGTSVYRIQYRLEFSRLFVWGDLGDAIYHWSAEISWPFLSSLDFDYFASKCTAAENGRFVEDWSEALAEAEAARWLGEINRCTWDEFMDKDPPLYSREEWLQWLHDEGVSVFGSDFMYDGIHNIGSVPHLRTLAHWKMLKMAVAGTPPIAAASR